MIMDSFVDAQNGSFRKDKFAYRIIEGHGSTGVALLLVLQLYEHNFRKRNPIILVATCWITLGMKPYQSPYSAEPAFLIPSSCAYTLWNGD